AETFPLPWQTGAIICVGPGSGRRCGRLHNCCWDAGPKSEPRWLMSPLVWMLTVWGVLTAILVVLLIYRSTLTMHEDDQLFLDESESHMEKEQVQLMQKVDRINPFVKWLGAASGLLILVIAGVALYQQLTLVQ